MICLKIYQAKLKKLKGEREKYTIMLEKSFKKLFNCNWQKKQGKDKDMKDLKTINNINLTDT